LLGLAGVLAWTTRVPVYATGTAVVAESDGKIRLMLIVPTDLLENRSSENVPAESSSAESGPSPGGASEKLHVGQTVWVRWSNGRAPQKTRIMHVEPEIRSPAAVRQRFGLSSATVDRAVVLATADAEGIPFDMPDEESCAPGRDGVTARTLVTAARSHGLRVQAYSVQGDALKDVALPAIVHWKFDHFLVLQRITPEGMEVVDPADGRHLLSAEDFGEGFTGVVLMLEPGPDFAGRSAGGKPLWRQFLEAMWRTPGTPGALVQILLASLLLQALGLGVPLFTHVLVDSVLPFRISDILAVLGLGMAILVVAQVVSGYLRAAVMIYLQARLDTQLMLGFFARMLSLPFRFFQQRSAGDLIMRLASNSHIRSTLTSQTLSIFLDGGLVLVYLAILFWCDTALGALSLGIGAVQIGLLLATLRPTVALTQMRLAAEAQAQGYLIEALTGIATLKATGAEDTALSRWSNLFFKELNIASRLGHLQAVIEAALLGLRTGAPLLLLWVGAGRVIEGSMTLGTMLGLTSLALSLGWRPSTRTSPRCRWATRRRWRKGGPGSPAASASGSRSPGPWPTSPRSCYSTRRPAISTW